MSDMWDFWGLTIKLQSIYFVYMKTAMLNVKIDPKVKREASKIAEDLGFSLSAIVNASLKELTRRRSISFSVLEPSPMLKKTIREARKARAKGDFYGPFSPEDAVSFLKTK